MARLYIKTQSDLRSGNGKCASQEASAKIFWGSANDSKLAGELVVFWPKGKVSPIVKIYRYSGVEVEIVG